MKRHGTSTQVGQPVAEHVFEDPVAQLVGERAPQVGREDAEREGEQRARGDAELQDTVDPQPRRCAESGGEPGRGPTADQRAQAEPADEVGDDQNEGEGGRAEAVDEDAEPRDLVDEAHQTREAVEAVDEGSVGAGCVRLHRLLRRQAHRQRFT